MGVYIKGMEMPTSCGECKAFVCYRQYAGDSGDCFCGITKSDAKVGARNADCPLVPVPPHGRLIDADALMAWFEEWYDPNADLEICHVIDILDDNSVTPTIIEAEEGE